MVKLSSTLPNIKREKIEKPTIIRDENGKKLSDSLPSKGVAVKAPSFSIPLGNDYDLDAHTKYLQGTLNPEAHKYLEQDKWDRWGNTAIQVGSELTLGTLEGTGYLLDLPQWYNVFTGQEREFGNWFSDLMIAGQDAIREDIAPIHSNPNEPAFAPWSSIWWTQNLPSAASAVSLMIPSMGAAGALRGFTNATRLTGKYGRMSAKLSKTLGKSTKTAEELAALGAKNANIQKGVSAAIFSRFMENTMEVSEVMIDLTEEFQKQGMTEEQAKLKAGERAAKAWYANSANLLWDLPQHLLAFGGLKAIAPMFKKVESSRLLNTGTQMLQEGAEEASQFVISEEAKAYDKEFFGDGFSERLGDYFTDGELYTSAFFGALGGGVFANLQKYGAKKAQHIQDGVAKAAEAMQLGRSDVAKSIMNEIFASNINDRLATEENLERIIEDWEAMMQGEDVDPEAAQYYNEVLKPEFQRASQEIKILEGKYKPTQAKAIAVNNMRERLQNKVLDTARQNRHTAVTQISPSELAPENQSQYEMQLEIARRKSYKTQNEAYAKKNAKEIKRLEKKYKEMFPEEERFDTSHNDILTNLIDQELAVEDLIENIKENNRHVKRGGRLNKTEKAIEKELKSTANDLNENSTEEEIQAALAAERQLTQAQTTEQKKPKGPTFAERKESDVYSKDGERGTLKEDGQSLIFETEDTIYELGNKDELSQRELSEFGISKEEMLDISVDEDFSVTIDGKKYVNKYSNPDAAINYDKDGNVVSVNLETENGQRRTFRGQNAEEIAYQHTLRKFEQNATDEQIKRATAESEQAQEQSREAAPQTEKRVVREEPKQQVVESSSVENLPNEVVIPGAVDEPGAVAEPGYTGPVSRKVKQIANRKAETQIPDDNAAALQWIQRRWKENNAATKTVDLDELDKRLEKAGLRKARKVGLPRLMENPEESAIVKDYFRSLSLSPTASQSSQSTEQPIPSSSDTQANTSVSPSQPAPVVFVDEQYTGLTFNVLEKFDDGTPMDVAQYNHSKMNLSQINDIEFQPAPGSTVRFVVENDNDTRESSVSAHYNGNLPKSKVAIYAEVMYNGEWVKIGTLPTVKNRKEEAMTIEDIQSFRNKVLDEFEAAGKPKGSFVYSKTGTYIQKNDARINETPNTGNPEKDFRAPRDAANMEVFFFMWVTEGEQAPVRKGITGNVPSDVQDFMNLQVMDGKITLGKPYFIIKGPIGYRLVRTFQPKIKTSEEASNQVRDLVNQLYNSDKAGQDAALTALNDLVARKIQVADDGTLSAVVYEGEADIQQYKDKPLSEAEMVDVLENSIFRVHYNKINTGDYNNQIQDEGRILTRLNPDQPFHSNTSVIGMPDMSLPTSENVVEESMSLIEEDDRTTPPWQFDDDSVSPQDVDSNVVIASSSQETQDLINKGYEQIGIDENGAAILVKPNTIQIQTDSGIEEDSDWDPDNVDVGEIDEDLGLGEENDGQYDPSISEPSIESMDEAAAQAWLEEKLGVKATFVDSVEEIPLTSDAIKSLLSVRKKGLFVNGIFTKAGIYLLRTGRPGTQYHEAFHAVWKILEDPKADQIRAEVTAILNEQGLENPTESDIEEYLADEFRDYMMFPELRPAKTKRNIIQKFFDKLLAVLGIATSPSFNRQNLFDQIDLGVYKGKINFSNEVTSFYDASQTSLFTNSRKKMARMSMVRGNLMKIINSVATKKGMKEADVFKKVAFDTALMTTLKRIIAYRNNGVPNLLKEGTITQEQHDYIRKELADLMRVMGKWNGNELIGLNEGFAKELKYYLESKYMNLRGTQTFEEIMDTDNAEIEDDGILAHTIESYEVNHEAKLNNEIKRFISNVRKKVISNGKLVLKKDDILYPEYYEPSTVYSKLVSNISNMFDIDHMMNKLKNSTDPMLQTIHEALEKNEEMKDLVFKNIAQMNNVRFIMSQITPGRYYKTFNSNRRNISEIAKNEVIANWKNLGKVKTASDAQAFITAIDSYIKRIQKLDKKNLDPKDFKTISETIQSVGIILPEDFYRFIIDTQYDEKTRRYKNVPISANANLLRVLEQVKGSLQNIVKGADSSTAISTNAAEIARILMPFYEHDIRNGFMGIKGTPIYGHHKPNFMSRLIAKLNSPKRAEVIAEMKRDPLLAEISFLNDDRTDFEYFIYEGANNNGNRVPFSEMTPLEYQAALMTLFNSKQYTTPVLSDKGTAAGFTWKTYDINEVMSKLNTYRELENQRTERLREFIKNNPNDPKVPELKELLAGNTNLIVPKDGDINQFMLNEFDKYWNYLLNQGMILNEKTGQIDNNILPKNYKNREDVYKFFANNYLANVEIFLLTSGDPIYYGGNGNMQKRNAQIYSDKNFNLDKGGYKVIYAKDIKEVSNAIGIPEKFKNAYKENNTTDGFTWISPYRWKTVIKSQREWTPAHDVLFQKLIGEDTTPITADESLLINPLKPQMYTQLWDKGLGSYVPTQHKNSEHVLHAELVVNSTDPTLQRIWTLMQNGITDAWMFDSSVKVGALASIDMGQLENMTDAQIAQYANTFENTDYGIQVKTDAHFLNDMVTFPTQLRTLFPTYVDMNETYTLGDGSTISGKDLLDKYYGNLHKNLTKSAKGFVTQFLKDPIGFLIRSDRSMTARKEEELRALPIFFPTVVNKNEQAINNTFNKEVTTQKVRGAAMVNMSNHGYSDELKIEVKDGITYIDVYLPRTSNLFYDENGIPMEIDDIPQELREIIGYRVPNEYAYSTFVMRVKGFKNTGGGIMLPREATTITGFDFDIDKFYLMLKDFNKNEDGSWNIPMDDTSTRGRNNQLIDMMAAVMKHSANQDKFFNPGGFDIVENNAYEIALLSMGEKIGTPEENKKAIKKLEDKMAFFSPQTQAIFLKRNMAGKKLISIGANGIGNHSKTVFSGLDTTFTFQFEGNPLNRLSDREDINGGDIIRTMATMLSAYVDNGKTPLADYFNLNTDTVPVFNTLLRLGVPLKTAMYFMGQPVVTDIVEATNSLGLNIRDAIKGMTGELGVDEGFSGDLNVTLQDLKKGFESPDIFNTEGEAFEHHQKIAYLFAELYETGRELDGLILSSKTDTTGLGDSLIEKNIILDRQIKYIQNKTKHLVGTSRVFGNELVKMFNDKLKSFRKDMKGVIPTGKGLFKHMTNKLLDITGGLRDKKDMKVFRDMLFTYMAYDNLFDASERTDIIENVPTEVMVERAKNPNDFLDLLFVHDNQLQFNSTGMLAFHNDHVVDEFKRVAETNPELYERLIKYAFFTSGFKFTPFSFMHVVPHEYWVDSGATEFYKYFDYNSKTAVDTEDFIRTLMQNTHRLNFTRKYRNPNKVNGLKLQSVENADGTNNYIVQLMPSLLPKSVDASHPQYISVKVGENLELFEKTSDHNNYATYRMLETKGNAPFSYDMTPGTEVPLTPTEVNAINIITAQEKPKAKKKLVTPESVLEKGSFRKIPVKVSTELKRDGMDSPVAAKRVTNKDGSSTIYINPDMLRDLYNNKEYTNMKTLKDGSKATALNENDFNSFEEFFTFVLLHEWSHTQKRPESGEELGHYEDSINTMAMNELRTRYALSSANEVEILMSEQNRIRKDYPNSIEIDGNEVKTSKIQELADINEDNDLIPIGKDESFDSYIERVSAEYGNKVGEYAEVVESNISKTVAEWIKSNPDDANTIITYYKYNDRAEGLGLSEFANIILQDNVTLVDTYQLDLFGEAMTGQKQTVTLEENEMLFDPVPQIKMFWNSLTAGEQQKLGPLEEILEEWDETSNTYQSVEDFKDKLRCR